MGRGVCLGPSPLHCPPSPYFDNRPSALLRPQCVPWPMQELLVVEPSPWLGEAQLWESQGSGRGPMEAELGATGSGSRAQAGK